MSILIRITATATFAATTVIGNDGIVKDVKQLPRQQQQGKAATTVIGDGGIVNGNAVKQLAAATTSCNSQARGDFKHEYGSHDDHDYVAAQ